MSYLLASAGAGCTAFAQSLDHLVELGLLERNPGHGHPLRPEYRLTAAGKEFAGAAARIKSLTDQLSRPRLLRRVWTVPVLAVSGKPQYFGEIKSLLGSITDRALSQSLKQLETQLWLNREFHTASRSARSVYQAANTAAQISQAIRLGAG